MKACLWRGYRKRVLKRPENFMDFIGWITVHRFTCEVDFFGFNSPQLAAGLFIRPILPRSLNRGSIGKKVLVVMFDFDFHVIKSDLVEK